MEAAPTDERDGPELDRVELVRRAVAALNRGDVDTYAAAFAPDCLRWTNGAGEAVPAATVAETLRQLCRSFADFRLTDELLVGAGEHVIARWRSSGVHTGEFAGMAPTGLPIDVQTCEVYEFAGNQVIATWSYGDPLELPRQLGLLGGDT
jgi:predicted ester cyclase